MEVMINLAFDEDFLVSDSFRQSDGIKQSWRKLFDPMDTMKQNLKSEWWCAKFMVSERRCQ